ncbi:uncharacterized protein BKA55DRAFT_698432 [Fusarium redolens]|uniref:Uncharacterized protein n=1 Tax=Fusarium redolens TaxID=48865 RepID=A0A9P9FYJ3_FUSRE|nr:uncharacterized protein BKA55DRAFT_698432 [Fusarium redolens]KAH7205829.1 hypothetical protein BKA55DRAFT_698432 [Fusarium redolens]
MADPTNAERLNYLLEMALVIHEGIIERLDEDHELDHPLIAHLKEADHFIVVKKALQDRLIDKASDNENEHVGGESATPPSHQSPLTIGQVNNYSPAPKMIVQRLPLPSLVLRLSHSTLKQRRLHDERSLVGSQENLETPRLCDKCGAQYLMQAGLTVPSERRCTHDRSVIGRGDIASTFYAAKHWKREEITEVPALYRYLN